MMTFYIGKDFRIYEQKWKEISLSFALEMEKKGLDPKSNAAVWRYAIDKLHKALNDSKKKEVA